jgi:eukaryotic-like serine/threonine-protein kinase
MGKEGSVSVVAACLDATTVLAFLEGTLPADARDGVERHLAACSTCAEMTTWVAADLANRSRPPGREGPPFVGELAPGSHFGRFQILGALGRGGMGEVYAAYHIDLDRRIALKVVYEPSQPSPEHRVRLLREARAVAKLSHPNVVSVYDAGTFDDRVYIAMEFVDGQTVSAWLAESPRAWADVVDVFVAAGRGLAAAHAANIVHRDFKPQNVMIGRDGSVRVTDFGLARLLLEEIPSEIRSDAASGEREPDAGAAPPAKAWMTQTGALLGTPAYMAPEQFRREPVDARSDQFSFCVALHEALYGARPTLAHLGPGATPEPPPAAAAAEPTRRAGAPQWLKAVVSRGLEVDPNKRFESMDQLLAVLTRGRTSLRRRALVAGVSVAVASIAFGGWRLSQARAFDCAASAEQVAAAWAPDGDDTRRATIRRVMLASGREDAQTIWQRLSSTLDEHVARWRAMYKESCEATRVRHVQSEEVFDLRLRCLNQNLDKVRALTDLMTTADTSVAGGALTASRELGDIKRCADVPLLRSEVPIPRDENTRKLAEGFARSLNEVRALRDVGHERAALDKAQAMRAAIEATRYKPLLAELLEVMARILTDLYEFPDAEKTAKAAMMAAEAGGDDPTRAQAVNTVAFTTGMQGRGAESEVWAQLTHAIIDRLGPGYSRIRGWAYHGEATIRVRQHDTAAARPLAERAIALKQEALGRDHPDVGMSLVTLGVILQQQGDQNGALAAADRALTIFLGNGGADGQWVGYVQNNRGEVLLALKRYSEAEEAFRHARRILEKLAGANQAVAYPLAGLGQARLGLGDSSGAVDYFEQALRLGEAKEKDPAVLADTRFGLARALWQTGRDRPRARTLAVSARDGYTTPDTRKSRDEVDAWLAAHRAR